ncbi:MAG: hypothetical protein KKD44_27975, partial [Proteobacteria bacterium]|nr:hypothetical protein [Pseudomonadota bacterium]
SSLTRGAIAARRRALYWDVDENATPYVEDEAAVAEMFPEEIPEDMSEVREVLENAGIAVSPDGTVSFYKTNIPGIYTDKLPQALPLSTAISLWEQKLEIADGEKARVKNIQDSLARLKAQVDERVRTGKSPKISEIGASLTELEEYGFDPRSRSEITKGISGVIENVFETVMGNNWMGAVTAIDEAQEVLNEYISGQDSDYNNDLYVWDALDKLVQLQESDPAAFEKSVGGLGGLAARLYAAFIKNAQEASATLLLDLNLGEFTEFARGLAEEFNVNESPDEFVDSLVNNEYEWMAGAIPNLLETGLLPGVSNIEIEFNDSDNYGAFEDELGGSIPSGDSDERGSIPLEMEPDEVGTLFDVIKDYVRSIVAEDKERGYLE